ncbi:GATOR1 complex protein NPRL2 isoform X4 [Dermacentor albipictus]|uniref:GATOR1 complex protein NPRL2 isoform X4 n=1 Tax=Dermacentor albipictus TaxID=60249 RepID=UPI0038FC7CD3
MTLGTVRDSLIKCIFFCEFHPTAGPKIMYQVPVNYISEETFSAISVYLIPKPELQHKLITVNMCEMKVIGYPVGIDSAEYDRNRLMFNLCFVCDAKMRTIQYEPIVRKLANYLTTLEQETNFIRDETKKCQLPEIMSKILHDLNIKRSCSIPINESTTIYLKVTTVHEAPRLVSDHDVPIFTASRPACTPSQWDLTTQQILPYIDGFRHVAKIAVEADVEVSLVKECIRNMLKLVQYGVMKSLLRRLHKYPIDLKRAADSTSKIKSVTKYFDGAHSYDDICAKTGMSYKELDDILDKDPNVCVCWK